MTQSLEGTPFTEDDKRRVQENMRSLEQIEGLISRGEVAGLDMADAKQRVREARTKLSKVNQAFFAGV